MIPDQVENEDLKQEVLLSHINALWTKLDSHTQEYLAYLAKKNAFKNFPPHLHAGEDGEGPAWKN